MTPRLLTRLSQARAFTVQAPASAARHDAFDEVVAVNPARSSKPRPHTLSVAECPFCQGRTPPAVLEVVNGAHVVPDETASLRHGNEWLAEHGPLDAHNAGGLLDLFAFYQRQRSAECRTFPNLYAPSMLGEARVMASLVTTLTPACHDADLADCPRPLLAKLFEAWALLEDAARAAAWTPVFFVNGGGRASGQSLPCPHAQCYLLDREPPLYGRLRDRHENLLTLARDQRLGIPVAGLERLALLAHPVPGASWSLLILPREPAQSPGVEAAGELALAYQQGLWMLRRRLGALPAYNLVLRTGIGHWTAEIIPRSTTIRAGAEIATGWCGVDAPPAAVRDELVAAGAVLDDAVS